MTHLIFSKNNRAVFKFPIQKENISIGRDPSNDIVLADLNISRLHCELVRRNSGYYLKNAGSAVTFVNGTSVTKSNIDPKDKILLGNWQVNLQCSPSSEDEMTAISDLPDTKVMSADTKKRSFSQDSLEISTTQVDGTETVRNLKKAEVFIGTSKTNEIQVTDDYVSKRHCKLSFNDGELFLADIGSTNGTNYHGEKIQMIRLPKHSSFIVGKTKIMVKIIREKNGGSEIVRMGQMIGASDTIKEIFALVRRVASTDATVFITGESGTGKELVAKSIHEESSRKRGPFVAVNCGAIPPSIIESELFGHEKGAFTGATQTHHGVFEQADGGTLFLDEVGEMPNDLQTRLLRVLETRTVKRIGGMCDIRFDARIIAATNQDIKSRVKEGNFREDLFFRLFIMPIHIQPLRERKTDIEVLANYFAKMFSLNGSKKNISKKAIDALMSYSWPGNVRELKNTIQRAVILNRSDTIGLPDINLTELRDARDPKSMPLSSQEKEAIMEALRRYSGNQTKAAELLGIARTTLSNKVRKYGIDLRSMKL